jgi:hypothetical protein
MDSGNFLDVYFGEFVALGKDVARAPGFLNKLKYMVMPPGWSHSGTGKTAREVRKAYMESLPAGLNKVETSGSV